MSFSDFITEGGLIFNSALAVLVAWIYWKQYRATSPSEIVRKVKALEESVRTLELDSEKSLLAIESLKLGIESIKKSLTDLDRAQGARLGDIRDEITRMESRIDDLYRGTR